MRDGLRIGVVSNHVRLTAIVLALVLATAVPGRSLAGEPAAKERIGQRVVPKYRDFALRETEDGPERAAKISVYRVDQVKGDSLRLTPPSGPSGWGDAAQVVSVDEAVEFFSDAIGKSPRDPHNFAMRAMLLLFEREDPIHALADCDGAIRLDPKYAFARGVRGAVRAATQELDSAIADFSEVIRLKPGEPDAYRDRGVARVSNRELDGAIADFNEAIRLDPKDSATFVCRATAWLSKEQVKKAMADFDEAIRLDPKNAEAYFLRGSLRGQRGEFDQAIADFTQIIKLDPQA
ncbi:MAG TPA: tetratricopeptide repeat protein, partial [Isosphaeraceae bacterium]|nr:tetratricopeptide repeat protein [Isosphaeraceae bacterium]